MVLTFDAVGELLDDLADRFPQEFYTELHGGIILLPESPPDDQALDLVTMGQYCYDMTGRRIELFYDAFALLAVEENWDKAMWEKELWDTLSHEFTHHLESLAGTHLLEDKDDAFLAHYHEGQEDDSLPPLSSTRDL